MRIIDVFILEEASDDLTEGKAFYDVQETGVGDYFWDCLISDIESLIIYAESIVKSSTCITCFLNGFPTPFTTKSLTT
jgi:hypothetical protein